MEPKKYEYIDSLRGIAILLVILGHVGNMLSTRVEMYFPELINKFVYNGHLGVQMFFVVSAFTLMISYENRKEEAHATKKFFLRRFFRIAPMYYLAMIFTTLQIINFDFASYNWSEFPKTAFVADALFINAIVPKCINSFVIGGWSVSVEFLFYFTLPFICAKIRSINGMLTFTLLTLLLSSLLLCLLRGTSVDTNTFLYYYFFNQVPVFGLGMLAYWINKEGFVAVIKPKLILLLLVTVIIYCFVTIPYPFLYSLIYFVLLLLLSRKDYSFLSNKVLAKIGQVSFSIYLVHFVVMYVLELLNFQRYVNIVDTQTAFFYFIALYLVLAIVSFILSHFTYKFIEVPGQNLGRKLIKKLDQRKINATI